MPRHTEKILALKMDIDTLRGYQQGLPRLLNLLKDLDLKSSIFFSFGPDNSGKAIRRIFRPGFLAKMWRTKAPSTYGIKTLFYGTLLHAPQIVSSDPELFKKAFSEGHDCGIHAWDHVDLQDKQNQYTEEKFTEEFFRAQNLFSQIAGTCASSFAAPGWQVGQGMLEAIEKLHLSYTSSTRGVSPFFPIFEGKLYRTLELPTTLPTMDEICGTKEIDDKSIPHLWLNALKPGYNALTFHAEMEGLSKISVFKDFLQKVQKEKIRIVTLSEAAQIFYHQAKPARVVKGYLPGRAGLLSIQERIEL